MGHNRHLGSRGYRNNVKRTLALQTLSHDHQHGLAVALRLKRVTTETALEVREAFLDFWASEGQVHFRAEEEVLLPAFAAHASAGHQAVVRVLVEHVEIRRRASEVAGGGDPECGELRELGELLEGHIRHEERVLFPLVEDALPRDDLRRLAVALEAAEAGS
jgi:iron-sulfur cluster repair protein YtfE (RIC family)